MTEYLIYFNQQWVGDHTEEWFRSRGPLAMGVVQEIRDAGAYVFAGGLVEEVEKAFSADATSGELLFSDGPYVETKEFLGGLTIVDVPDEETARMWAGKIAEAVTLVLLATVVPRLLGPHDYGQFSVVLTLVAIGSVALTLGGATLLARYVPAAPPAERAPLARAMAMVSASSASSFARSMRLRQPAGHRAAIRGQPVLEVRLAAESLEVGGLHPGRADVLVRQPLMCLSRCNPTISRVGRPGRPT